MKVPVAPALQHVHAVDQGLIEALSYFSEEATAPVIVDVGGASRRNKDPVAENADAMLLSLDVQELLHSDEDDHSSDVDKQLLVGGPSAEPVETQSMSMSSMSKADQKLRPYSTSTRRDRRRPKHELDYLRAKVVELQEELMTLGLSSWKEIAERQKREVATAIDRNRQLRNRLLNQLQVAHALEASIRQHESDAATSCQYEWMNTGMSEEDRSSLSRIMDEQIFAQLNSTLETQLEEIDSIFTTHGLSSVLHRLQGGFAFNREANGISFRYEEARLLPFSWQALHHTIWNSLHDGSIHKHTEAHMINHDWSNIFFRDTIQLFKSRQITITKWAAFRRHIEQDRVVFVWNNYVQIDGSVSVRLTERGWSTTSTFEFHRDVSQGTNDSSDFVQGCITRLAVQLVPEISEFESKQEARMHVGEMADLIVGFYHQNYSSVHEVAEKLLQSGPGTSGNEEGVKSGVVQMF